MKLLVVVETLNGRRIARSEEHTSELQSLRHLVCRLLLEKKKKHNKHNINEYTEVNLAMRHRHKNMNVIYISSHRKTASQCVYHYSDNCTVIDIHDDTSIT